MALLNITKAEFRAVCARLRSHLAEGKEHDEIAQLLGLTAAEFQELLKRFFESEADDLRGRTTEEVYVDYTLRQTQNIKDLTRMLGAFEESKQHSAMVGAVRARSDILDKIITKGQEFGFIEKKPETKIVAGMIVSQLSTPDLRRAISDELGNLDRLMSRFGDAPGILDIDIGPVHIATPKKKALAEGVKTEVVQPEMQKGAKKHARSRVHKGRKVLKVPAGEPPY